MGGWNIAVFFRRGEETSLTRLFDYDKYNQMGLVRYCDSDLIQVFAKSDHRCQEYINVETEAYSHLLLLADEFPEQTAAFLKERRDVIEGYWLTFRKGFGCLFVREALVYMNDTSNTKDIFVLDDKTGEISSLGSYVESEEINKYDFY